VLGFSDWFPMAAVGLMFTLFGSIKLWGLSRGIVGGADKPVFQRICGTPPTWESRSLRLGFPLLFLGVGLINLGRLGWLVFTNLRSG